MRKCKHGQYRSPEYPVWQQMNARCTNARHPKYHRYGGRGICVCERWRDFGAFIADMGQRPSPQYSLDRIDNDGNYEPGNCRWATRTQQQRNMASNRIVSFRGVKMPLAAAADAAGISRKNAWNRVSRGWSVERALTTPVIAYGGATCR